MNYQALSKKVLVRAKKMGAQQADVFIQTGRHASVSVRDGDIEDLTEATSKGLGLRVFYKNRLGFAYTSDFTTDSLSSLVDRAVELAAQAASNPAHGLPDKKTLGQPLPLKDLFDPQVATIPADWKIKAALEIEKAGKAQDARIKTFESVGAGESISEVFLANSEGFTGNHAGTFVYLFAMPVASADGQLQTGYWVDYKRFLSDLDSPEQVGKEAARRAVRMLGAKKVPTSKVPVIFDPLMAASFVGTLASATHGDAVFKKSSFLAPLLGKKVGPQQLNVVDDPHLQRGLGSAPFDGEGVATRKSYLFENGVLQHFLYDVFTAKKAKTRSTGHAARGYRSLPSIGTHNLYLEAGSMAPEDMIRQIKDGFYVTSMLGHGANIVTGEYSRGANGLWIENGELAYPVQEVTVAGKIPQMLANIDAIGNDLEFRGFTNAPTLRFSELTVSGA